MPPIPETPVGIPAWRTVQMEEQGSTAMLQLSHGGLGASIDDTHRYNSTKMFQVPRVPDSGVGVSHRDSSGKFQCLDISRWQVSVRQEMSAHESRIPVGKFSKGDARDNSQAPTIVLRWAGCLDS